MLQTSFTRNRTQTMSQAEPAGPYLDAFTPWLEQQGYRQDTICRRRRGAAQFVAWAHAAGWHVHDLNSTLLAELQCHLARCGQRVYPSGHPTVRSLGAQHCLAFVQAEGLAAAPATTSMSALPPSWSTSSTGCTDTGASPHRHSGITPRFSSICSLPSGGNSHRLTPKASAPFSWTVPVVMGTGRRKMS